MDYLISRFNSFLLGTQGITKDNLLTCIKRDFKFIPGSDVLVICLPGWGGELNKWKIVKGSVAASRRSFLAYEFPRGIFSDQINPTKT